MHAEHTDASPAKSVLEELERARLSAREVVSAYAARLDEEIVRISQLVESGAAGEKISGSKLRDMRDMLTVLRTTSLKPGKGRRKDLKKVDSLLEDLSLLVENW